MKVLVIGKVWPEPASSAAGTRMMQLLEALQAFGYEIHFATAANRSGFEADLSPLCSSVSAIELNNSSFNHFVSKLRPTLVIFDRFMTEEQFGWRVHEECPSAITVLDSEDLHFLRDRRQQQLKGESFKPLTENDVALRELASIYRCDLTLVISKKEMGVLEEIGVPDSLLLYLPYMYDELKAGALPTFDERKDFVFAGNFLHAPNVDAVKFLRSEIWPLIKQQLPDARMNIYGAYVTSELQSLHDPKKNFLVHGRAADIMQIYRTHRVCLAPLRFGAGLKGKLVECMQAGTPSVTTSVGAEGLREEEGQWCGAVCDDPRDFAKAALHLYTSRHDWERCQKTGIAIHNELFKESEHRTAFKQRLSQLSNELNAHRAGNVVGAMLRHQQFYSSRYMSLYIETKNQLRELQS